MRFLAATVFVAMQLTLVTSQLNWPNCGANYTAKVDLQQFATPNYPAFYRNDDNCAWLITSGVADKQVEIQFSKMYTERCCDYVEVYDGSSANAAKFPVVLRGFVNQTYNFVSTFGSLFVRFVSDDSINSLGFLARYRIVSDSVVASCGGETQVKVGSSEVLTSPNYPLNYFNNVYCLWTLKAPAGYQIKLSIINYNVELCCDHIVVKDGDAESSKMLALLAGSGTKQRTYQSTGGILTLRFRSDGSINSTGFIAVATSVPTPSDVPTITPPSYSCRENLTTPLSGHANFTSPFYPNPHPGDLSCYWIISSPIGTRIHIWFGLINTERCCDWIVIRDGASPKSPKIVAISGTASATFPNYVSTTNVMRVKFSSDDVINKRGFRAYYEIYQPGKLNSTSKCGGQYDVTSVLQYFSSPGFPDAAYGSGVSCTWVFVSPLGTRIQFEFLGVHLEKNGDHLTVYNGAVAPGRFVFRFTGQYLAVYKITIGNNGARVVLKTNNVIDFAGFRATYKIAGNIGPKK